MVDHWPWLTSASRSAMLSIGAAAGDDVHESEEEEEEEEEGKLGETTMERDWLRQ